MGVNNLNGYVLIMILFQFWFSTKYSNRYSLLSKGAQTSEYESAVWHKFQMLHDQLSRLNTLLWYLCRNDDLSLLRLNS